MTRFSNVGLGFGLLLSLGAGAQQPVPSDDPVLNRAYNDHIAYVATFAMPVVIETCSALAPGYLNKAAPAYFRYVNARQDQIERGRLLTLAELAPEETLQAYRSQVMGSRLGALQSGTPEQKLQICDGVLGMLVSGANLPGEWPSRPAKTKD